MGVKKLNFFLGLRPLNFDKILLFSFLKKELFAYPSKPAKEILLTLEDVKNDNIYDKTKALFKTQ